MACSGNWVCFDCRITKRRPTWRQVTHANPETIGMQADEKCQQCSKLMYFLGPTIKIPPKSKVKEWKLLYFEVMALRLDLDRYSRIHKVKMKHAIERSVEELQNRGVNKERARLIKQYEKQLQKYT
jgi:hypothetical protein